MIIRTHNRLWLAYCQVHNLMPDHKREEYTEYIIWCNKMSRTYKATCPGNVAGGRILDIDKYLEWVEWKSNREDGESTECDKCSRFFARFRCNAPDECDCPKCQGMCECE
jgi:hypothetical protein